MTAVVLEITRRHGIYRVIRDGVFYGDYTTKAWAIESADEVALKLREQGRRVEIAVSPDQTRL